MPDSFLLYDGECPVCRNYVAWANLRAVRPDIELIDARHAPDLVGELRAAGIEVNDTMVLRLGSMTLHGADAFATISRLGKPHSRVVRMALRAFSNPSIATPLYPILSAARRLLLFLLGRALI